MKNSCLRDTETTNAAQMGCDSQLIQAIARNQISKSVELALVGSKKKKVLTQSLSGSGIQLQVYSNLKPKRKALFQANSKRLKTNESVALKPKTIVFPRLNSLGRESDEKQLSFERSKSSKRSINLRKILNNHPSVRFQLQGQSNPHGLSNIYEQKRLQKISVDSIFLIALPKNRVWQQEDETKREENPTKHIKIKRLDRQGEVGDGPKFFMPLVPTKTNS